MGRRPLLTWLVLSLLLSFVFLGLFGQLSLYSNFGKFSPKQVDFSPSGDRIAILHSSSVISVHSISMGHLQDMNPGLEVLDISWSPNDLYFVILGMRRSDGNYVEGILQVYDGGKYDLLQEVVLGEIEGSSFGSFFGEIVWSSNSSFLEVHYDATRVNSTSMVLRTSDWNPILKFTSPVFHGGHNRIVPNSDFRYFVKVGYNALNDYGSFLFRFDAPSQLLFRLNSTFVSWLGSTKMLVSRGLDFGLNEFAIYDLNNGSYIPTHNSSLSARSIANYNGTLLMEPDSLQYNTIWNALTGKTVGTFNHTGQDWPEIFFPEDTPTTLLHFWSKYTNLVAHTQYYENGNRLTLKVFDVDRQKYLAEIGP